jgi:hypothetical protein
LIERCMVVGEELPGLASISLGIADQQTCRRFATQLYIAGRRNF